MLKLKNKIALIIVSLVVLVGSDTAHIYGHSGRTDSNGGHRDNKNVSGLGSYHYHHGYGPHLHTNGCPYESNNNSSNNNSSNNKTNNAVAQQSAKKQEEAKKQKVKTEGYNKGYNDGYNNSGDGNSSYSGDYTSEYNEGYNDGYEKGLAKINEEVVIVNEKGYEVGLAGQEAQASYTNNLLVSAYNEGHTKGYSEYTDTKIKEYKSMGESDSKEDKDMMTFPEDTKEEFKNAYIESYNKVQDEIKEEYKSQGYKQALTGISYEKQDLEKEKYEKWFEEGFKEGKAKLDEEIKKAYNMGYEGEEFKVESSLEDAREMLQKSFNEGKALRDKETSDTMTGVVATGAIVGGVVYYRKKKKKKSMQ